MGIKGLLPFLNSITKRVHIREYANKTVAVDGYVWYIFLYFFFYIFIFQYSSKMFILTGIFGYFFFLIFFHETNF